MHSHILQLCSWTWQLDAAIYTTLLGLRTMDALNTVVYARMLLGFANYLHTECCHCIWKFSEQFTNFMHLVKCSNLSYSFRFYEIICIECDNYMRMISKQLAKKNNVFFVCFFNELQAAQDKALAKRCERELRHPSVLSPLARPFGWKQVPDGPEEPVWPGHHWPLPPSLWRQGLVHGSVRTHHPAQTYVQGSREPRRRLLRRTYA